MDEVFIDGVHGAGFSQGAVRVTFHSLVHDPDVKKEPNLRVIMTTEGFLDVYARFSEIMAQLKASGVVREVAPGQVPPGQAAGGQAAPGQGGPSPNFS